MVINMIMSIMCMNPNLPLFDIYLTIPTLPCIALHHFMSSFFGFFSFRRHLSYFWEDEIGPTLLSFCE